MPQSIALPNSRWMRCAAVVACLGGAALLSGCVVPPVDSSYSSTTVYTTSACGLPLPRTFSPACLAGRGLVLDGQPL